MSQNNEIIISIVIIVIFLLLAIFFIIVLTAYIYKRKRSLIAEKKAIRASYENELLKTQLEVQEQTFAEISQEIHDNIGQALSFIKLTINTVNIDDPANAKDKLFQSKNLITQAIQDLRNLSKTLSTDFITQIGLPKAIEQQLSLLEKSKIFKTRLIINGEPKSYGNKEELVIYRIVQELLNNAVKHSDAKNIDVEINYYDEGLSIIVSDDGKGFDEAKLDQEKGLGLSNMKKRMELINGKFEITTNVGIGTKAVMSFKSKL